RRRAFARQGFLTQSAAKFAEKTCAYACEDGFLFESSCSPLDLQAKMVYNKTTAKMMIKRR
ncbi:MAG: hypothetical protein KH324_01515, partial [Ruminococcus sp.]|nr:hypothetical protein [Ruminococcus sp.]